jgi:hypothetical protein
MKDGIYLSPCGYDLIIVYDYTKWQNGGRMSFLNDFGYYNHVFIINPFKHWYYLGDLE